MSGPALPSAPEATQADTGGTVSATVLNIQRMSSEDGPGLRTTVFLKGCSLECAWCHNPEAVCARPQLVWHRERCIGSLACLAACPESALQSSASGNGSGGQTISVDQARCTVCDECVQQCPSGALVVLGRRWSVNELFEELLKDLAYLRTYGGGITVSGGEPGLHPNFVDALLERCRARGIHSAVDTCGMCSPGSLRRIAGNADLVLYDLKEIDSDRHREFTGQDNRRILSNLLELGLAMRRKRVRGRLWVRTPLIPGATAREDNLLGIGAFLARELEDVVERWELCAFNNLAADKYERLGRAWPYAATPLLSEQSLRACEAFARASGVKPGIVRASGPVRVACEQNEGGPEQPS